MMALVAVIAVTFAALNDPTDLRLSLLLYAKVGILLWATFCARYSRGRAATWWFGFAAFGWAQMMISTLNPAVKTAGDVAPWYRQVTDIAGTIGGWLHYHASHGPYGYPGRLAEVVRFWMNLGIAVIGGLLALALAPRIRQGERNRQAE
jgi:hypothetical protein